MHNLDTCLHGHEDDPTPTAPLLFSLMQRKELGVMVFNCSCLALDLHRVFLFYWQLHDRDYIPSIWSKRVTALYGKHDELELQLNSSQAVAYVSVSTNSSLLHKASFFSFQFFASRPPFDRCHLSVMLSSGLCVQSSRASRVVTPQTFLCHFCGYIGNLEQFSLAA